MKQPDTIGVGSLKHRLIIYYFFFSSQLFAFFTLKILFESWHATLLHCDEEEEEGKEDNDDGDA